MESIGVASVDTVLPGGGWEKVESKPVCEQTRHAAEGGPVGAREGRAEGGFPAGLPRERAPAVHAALRDVHAEKGDAEGAGGRRREGGADRPS